MASGAAREAGTGVRRGRSPSTPPPTIAAGWFLGSWDPRIFDAAAREVVTGATLEVEVVDAKGVYPGLALAEVTRTEAVDKLGMMLSVECGNGMAKPNSKTHFRKKHEKEPPKMPAPNHLLQAHKPYLSPVALLLLQKKKTSNK